MKKLVLILTVLVLAPLATQAENVLNTDESFQVARVFKLGRESSSPGFLDKTIGWFGQKKGSLKNVHIVCKAGFVLSGTVCVDICSATLCKDGKTASKAYASSNSCCCK